MKLKHVTMAVLVCLGLSLAWTLVSFVLPPEALTGIYESRLPALLYIARDISLIVFFAFLLKNQR
jgi:hypothetical protein